ncbi:MAG: PHP domain-containing protein [Clostridia bacterium]|nr:PHP domain-containing protein [Clostridia bacterium]
MILTADYHTHTVFSHGKGNICDNVKAASLIGLKEIGITDHGFNHPAFGLTKRKIPRMRLLCGEAEKEFGVKTYLGIESNIVGIDGTTDLTEKRYDDFDLFLAGFHKFVVFRPSAGFKIFVPDMFTAYFKKDKPSASLIRNNTKMFINVIKTRPVDAITHLNFFCFADAAEVAKAASDYGTYIELNSKKVHLSDEELYAVSKTGVRFIIDSDAHSPKRVGDISLVEETLKRVDIDLKRIDNIDGRLPSFRFAAFKGAAGR